MNLFLKKKEMLIKLGSKKVAPSSEHQADALRVRQDIKVLIEQPSSSWAFHLPEMKRVIAAWSMSLGFYDVLSCFIYIFRIIYIDVFRLFRCI